MSNYLQLYGIGSNDILNIVPSGDRLVELTNNRLSYSGVLDTSEVNGFYQGLYFPTSGKLQAKYHIYLDNTYDWYMFGDYNYSTKIKTKTFELANPDVFYADVKQYKDIAGIDDKYTVTWFKNGLPLNSGDVLNPRLSVFNTSDGNSVFVNQNLTFANNQSAAKYNVTSSSNHLNSGEAYLVVTSGLIESQYRTWEEIIGIDFLY